MGEQYSWLIVGLFILIFSSTIGHGAEVPLDTTRNEQVLFLPGDPDRPVLLQVTTFSPEGPGPFPLAVINHGKIGKQHTKDHPRNRAIYLASYFLSRGYFVALPMLRGFADSGGLYNSHGEDVEALGLSQIKDLAGGDF